MKTPGADLARGGNSQVSVVAGMSAAVHVVLMRGAGTQPVLSYTLG